jgi:adenylyltransferase/sulfurtransferase
MIDFSCQDKTAELCAEARGFIAKTRIAIIGLGALGTAASHALVRSGAKRLLLIDDDVIEESNLPRQSLYAAVDVGKEKVVVAKEKLLEVNKDASIEAKVTRITSDNATLLKGAELVLDCTDNLKSRKIIDEYCFSERKPWVHAAVIRSQGEVMAVLPDGKRYIEVIKGKSVDDDCADEGVLSIAAIMTGTFQATIALRLLAGKQEGIRDILFRLDCWEGRIDKVRIQ